MQIQNFSIATLPDDLWHNIFFQCDSFTFSRLRQTCRRARLLGSTQAQVLSIAHKVFHDPKLYTQPQLTQFRHYRAVAVNALLNMPELFFSPTFPAHFLHDSEMKKTTLVAAKLMNKADLCTRLLCEYKDDAFSTLAEEVDTYLTSPPPARNELWDLHAFALHAPYSIDYSLVSSEIRQHFEIALTRVNRYSSLLQQLDTSFRDNEVIVTSAIKNRGTNLEYASRRLQDSTKIVRLAVSQIGFSLAWASERLQSDYKTVKMSLYDTSASFETSPSLCSMRLPPHEFREIFLLALRKNGNNLILAPPWIKKEEQAVLIAVQNGYDALKHADPLLQDNEKIVLESLRNHPPSLEFASDRLKDTEKTVQVAVQKQGWGWVLRYASARQQGNKKLVLIAVKSCGAALEFASPLLQDDIDVVRASVNQKKYPYAFHYASARLKAHPELCYSK